MKKAMIMVLVVLMFAGPGRVEAATTRISYINSFGAFRTVFPGKKFRPTKKITRREFVIILRNLYGATYAPTTYEDLAGANKKITAKFACDRMVAISAKLDYKIKWNGKKGYKLSRADAAEYIYIFCTFSDELKPRLATN